MGAVRMRVQTADNITIIQTAPVHQLTSLETKSCMFVRNKSVIKMFLSSNHWFRLKYESIIHNNTSSNEKVIFIRKEICRDQELFKHMWLDFDMRDNRGWIFSLEDALLLWIFKCSYKVIKVLMKDLLTNMHLLASRDINWRTGVVWLLGCFISSFTAEDTLVNTWCNARFLQIYILLCLRLSKFLEDFGGELFL